MITIEDVAKHWSLTPATVRRYAKDGRILTHRIGRQYRVEWIDVWACEDGRPPRGKNQVDYMASLGTKAALAEEYSVSVRTVERWIKDGMPTRNVFENVRIQLDEARRWLNTRFSGCEEV